LRATTRQAFQLHGVLKGNLKSVIAAIANVGSNTYGGCGDINRNVMTPPVHLPNNPAYSYCLKYARAIADLFKPSTTAFTELWLDGKPAMTTEYWQKDIEEFDLDKVRVEDRGNGIITGHPVEPLYGRTYLPKKFKIAITVPGDNGVDLYINDIGIVVIMSEDGKTLDGFNIMVGGGMGRTHRKETTFARAATHLGYVPKEEIFECLKAILAVQRDHGNREVRQNARLKYLVHTLGIDDFRILTEKYFGQKIQPWKELQPWKYMDWMGWHEQGDGKWMFGINVEQGRVIDRGELRLKTALRKLADNFGVDLLLTPSQSIVLRHILPEDREKVQTLLKEHGIKMIEEVDDITRKSMACPAFPLCGLAMTEAERIQPEMNTRLNAQLKKMGLEHLSFITRTTGCPNGCARPYMAELAFVGSGPQMYQVWLGGSPVGAERTAFESHMFKMKLKTMEDELEPIFAMYKEQCAKDEAFGDFCWRVGKDAIEEYCKTYDLGSYEKMPTPEHLVSIDKEWLKKIEVNWRDTNSASI
jgi:sulfite reductase (ferredoxin)